MIALFAVLWPVVIFAPLAQHGFLLFYTGVKDGREVTAKTGAPDRRDEERKA
jgi:hypothetical protein